MNTKPLFAALVVVLMFIMVIPAADAQVGTQCGSVTKPQVDGEFTLANSKIQPITGLENLALTFTVTAEEQATSVTSVPITMTAKADKPWATVTLDKGTSAVQMNSQGKTNAKVNANVALSVSQQAPAFDKANIIITAKTGEGTCVPASEVFTMTVPIQAGFYENYQARFDQAIWKTGQNQRLQIPMTLDNFGNGPIRVQFAWANPCDPSKSDACLSLALPGPQFIDSTVSGDTNKLNIPIDVQTPFKNGYENRRDNLVIGITGASAFDPTLKVTELQLTAVIQTQGVYVPGFEAVTMLAAVIGLGLVGRFRF